MTKQDIVREGIISKLRVYEPLLTVYQAEEEADKILAYLHDNDVVLRVKCPDCEWSQFGEETVGMTPCYSCNSTGYIVESLIKGE